MNWNENYYNLIPREGLSTRFKRFKDLIKFFFLRYLASSYSLEVFLVVVTFLVNIGTNKSCMKKYEKWFALLPFFHLTQSEFESYKNEFQHCTPLIIVSLASFSPTVPILKPTLSWNTIKYRQDLHIPKYFHLNSLFLALFLHCFSVLFVVNSFFSTLLTKV